MRKLDKPYRRTHTMNFWWCDRSKILSPMTPQKLAKFRSELIRCLTSAGFIVTEDARGRKDVQVHPFGEKFGFTALAILSESHCAIHTYPERKFKGLAEVEFNLCYLTCDHGPKLQAFVPLFSSFLRATKVTVQNSRRRYFTEV